MHRIFVWRVMKERAAAMAETGAAKSSAKRRSRSDVLAKRACVVASLTVHVVVVAE